MAARLSACQENFLKLSAINPERKGKENIMKTKSLPERIHSSFTPSRLRLAAAGVLVLGAAALAGVAVNPKLPWQAPIVRVGNFPFAVALNAATNTIYVPNSVDNTISVIDGSQCNASHPSHCSPIATMTNVGFGPSWPIIDPSTATLYVTDSLTESGDDGNTVSVLDLAHCNAQDASGCSQGAVALVTVGSQVFAIPTLALDPSIHTLYVGDANDGALAMINSATCNAHQTSGCNQVVMSGATGAFIQIDQSNHSVYVVGQLTPSLNVFNGATCNADTQADCSTISVAQLPPNYLPWVAPAIETSTHTLYLPVQPDPGVFGDVLSYAAVIDGSTCNGIDHSGCGRTPRLVQTGAFVNCAFIDAATKTAYLVNSLSASLSVIDAVTCNGKHPAGCPEQVPALATGLVPLGAAVNPNTHTIYSASNDTNTVWVLDASKCNGRHTEGCTKFEPTTTVGGGAQAFANNPYTHTLYETNQSENTVSIIDSAVCNSKHVSGCEQTWPKFEVGNLPRFLAVNRVTNTIYLGTTNDNTLTVINGATCNSGTTSGCTSLATTAVGTTPQQVAVDEATNTIYVVNQHDNAMSVVDGTHCNGTDTSGCGQSWPTAPVGHSPQALTFNSNNRTIYVTNTNDNSVSVINGNTCNRMTTSGCVPVATIPVGAGPRAVGVVLDKNTVFVGNRDDLTVSVIDGATCNGTNTFGCPQVAPPAIVVGAFPETGGFDFNLLGRSITVDQQKHIVLIPVAGDSDVAMLDGNACRVGHVNDCHVKIVNTRMGGFPITAAVDEASETVYVANNADGTVSLFHSSY